MIDCETVWREVSEYLDGAVRVELRAAIDQHIRDCGRCAAVVDGARNVVRLAGNPRTFPLPQGFGERLRRRLRDHALYGAISASDMVLGITPDLVPLGSHLIYFWESDQDFVRAVRFLLPGLQTREHCIAFGHQEATDRVLEVLRAEGYDPDRLRQEGALSVLRRHAAAQVTLSEISVQVEAALRAGATAVRFLGNLGMGRDPLPAGEDDVAELENRVTTLISRYPCVVVCMYDVRTLSGRMLWKGGLEAHRLAVCADGPCENPYFLPEAGFHAHRHPIQ
jgi:hypothetical protein